MSTITVTTAQLNTIVAQAVAAAMAEFAPTQEPKARTRKAPKADPKADEFVGWLRDTAEARKARKSENEALSAWMRSKGLHPGGSAWTLAKGGEKSVAKLRKANAADKAAREAAKA